MTVELESVGHNKEPTTELMNAIFEVTHGFQKTADAIDNAFRIGREQGFNDKRIGDLIREQMLAAGLTDRAIRKALPPTAKHTEKANKRYAEKSSASQADTVSIPTDYNVVESTSASASSTRPDGNEVEVEQEDTIPPVPKEVGPINLETHQPINEEIQELKKIIQEKENEIITLKKCPPHITPPDVSNTVIAQGERIRELEEIIHSQKTGYTKASNLTEKIFTQTFPVQDTITYFFAQIRKLYPGAVMEYVVSDGNEVIDARVASYGKPK